MRTGTRTAQPLRFPGQEVAMNREGQEENYNIFRWYRSGWERYTQSDRIGLAGGVNPYRYTTNPLRDIDPLGLMRIHREEIYDYDPSMDGITDQGATDPSVNVKWDCIPAGNGWRLEFDVHLKYTIHYANDAVKEHEQQQIVIFEIELYPYSTAVCGNTK